MENGHSSHPHNWVPAVEQPLFTRRRLRVVSIGAGFANLMFAYKIMYEWKAEDWIDHVIYEKNHEVGGTWLENRYPGVACDVPAHVYTFPFEPNAEWTQFYASGPEIWEYIRKTTTKWSLDKNVKLNSRIISSVWNETTAKWDLKIETKDGIIADSCDILVNGSGILNHWKWPDIPGLRDFQGHLVHTAAWKEDYDYTGKRVAVIGNGSSAIQVVPKLQKLVSHLTNLIRSPTWVSPNMNTKFTRGGNGKNFFYTDDEKKKFREDPEALKQYRKTIESSFNRFFWSLILNTKEQEELQSASKKLMEEALQNDPELIGRFVPEWKVGCRRITPGEDYLESLQESNVATTFTPIDHITETGLVLQDGTVLEVDAIVCATGFDVSFAPRWEVKGRRGTDLSELWRDSPEAYMGICAPDIPNYFIFNGPNCPIGHGSVLAELEFAADYILNWIHKISTENIKCVSIKQEAVSDYNVYTQEFLKRTVWTTGCRSWYKNGQIEGKITALYAGSILHYGEMLKDLRAEHFDIEYNSKNRFSFMGNGLTIRETAGGDMAFYMYN